MQMRFLSDFELHTPNRAQPKKLKLNKSRHAHKQLFEILFFFVFFSAFFCSYDAMMGFKAAENQYEKT